MYIKYNNVAVRFKAWVYCRSLGGTEGSIPTEGMDVCLVWVLCVVRDICVGLITHAEEFYRVGCVRVWSWSLDNEAVPH